MTIEARERYLFGLKSNPPRVLKVGVPEVILRDSGGNLFPIQWNETIEAESEDQVVVTEIVLGEKETSRYRRDAINRAGLRTTHLYEFSPLRSKLNLFGALFVSSRWINYSWVEDPSSPKT